MIDGPKMSRQIMDEVPKGRQMISFKPMTGVYYINKMMYKMRNQLYTYTYKTHMAYN